MSTLSGDKFQKNCTSGQQATKKKNAKSDVRETKVWPEDMIPELLP